MSINLNLVLVSAALAFFGATALAIHFLIQLQT
jgi:hypothetical protein